MSSIQKYDVPPNGSNSFRPQVSILSIQMHYAHDRGASIEAIAAKVRFSEEWVSERIEAARLSIEHQVMIRTAGV
jgi:hypothetical protein